MNPTQSKAIIEQKINEAGSDEEDENDENEEEDEHGVSTSNFNKTSGSINVKKRGEVDTEPRFEINLEDRLMRNRDRYLVNPTKHPGY